MNTQTRDLTEKFEDLNLSSDTFGAVYRFADGSTDLHIKFGDSRHYRAIVNREGRVEFESHQDELGLMLQYPRSKGVVGALETMIEQLPKEVAQIVKKAYSNKSEDETQYTSDISILKGLDAIENADKPLNSINLVAYLDALSYLPLNEQVERVKRIRIVDANDEEIMADPRTGLDNNKILGSYGHFRYCKLLGDDAGAAHNAKEFAKAQKANKDVIGGYYSGALEIKRDDGSLRIQYDPKHLIAMQKTLLASQTNQENLRAVGVIGDLLGLFYK